MKLSEDIQISTAIRMTETESRDSRNAQNNPSDDFQPSGQSKR